MFDLATRRKLRFSTSKGNLSVEQLWDLSLNSLATLAKDLNEELKKTNSSDELSFLDQKQTADPDTELSFEIVKHIYTTKKNEALQASVMLEKKAHNQKILNLIKEKEEEDLRKLSVDDLKKQLL